MYYALFSRWCLKQPDVTAKSAEWLRTGLPEFIWSNSFVFLFFFYIYIYTYVFAWVSTDGSWICLRISYNGKVNGLVLFSFGNISLQSCRLTRWIKSVTKSKPEVAYVLCVTMWRLCAVGSVLRMSVNLRVCMLRSLHINYSAVFCSHYKDRLQRTYFEVFFRPWQGQLMLNCTPVPLLFHIVLTMAKAFIVLCDVFFCS